MNDIWIANLIGVVTLPLAVWQFGFSNSKKHFLLINVLSCVLWFISLDITHQYTAAWVALTAGIASLIQAGLSSDAITTESPVSTIVEYSDGRTRTLYAWITALLAINVSVYMAPPVTAWDILPVVMFIWVRVSEVFSELVMRVLVSVSPLVWATIAWHGHNYGLVPGDILAFLSMFWWFFKNRSSIDIRPAISLTTADFHRE